MKKTLFIAFLLLGAIGWGQHPWNDDKTHWEMLPRVIMTYVNLVMAVDFLRTKQPSKERTEK